MKREIKFRAWNKNQKRFIDLNGFDTAFGNMENAGKIMQIYEQGNLKSYDLTDVELEQFTRLKDKNDKDIYEGDIVQYTNDELDDTLCIIVYLGTSFSTQCIITKDLGDMYGFELEIKGNIHENPELLK